ncbi:hypothetical protein [Actinomadura gamaensis]|uniref:Uncharacterized protein n=1 Tax=Actinomadura gamaensis TaxID=1763541 RepID=A0ABV9U1T1_9ACTN
MNDHGQALRTNWHAWWQGWPHWVSRAAVLWALAYGAFGLGSAVRGTPLFHGGSVRGPVALDWAVVAVAALAVPACGRAMRHRPGPALRALLRALCGLTAVAAFSLLMDVITMLTGQGVDDGPAAAHRLLAAVGALLLGATARADRRPAGHAIAPAPSRASARTQIAACAGTAAFVPYVAMKMVWVSGGTFAGVSGEEMLAISKRNGASGIWLTLESWGLDVTVLLALIGTFLLWGLVRPWGQVFPRWTPALRGRRVPRWLPLAPALLGAATLAPYGLFGLAYCALATTGAVTMRQGDVSSADELLMGWIGMVAFAGYGVALTLAARSYWLRTRPIHRTPVPAE